MKLSFSAFVCLFSFVGAAAKGENKNDHGSISEEAFPNVGGSATTSFSVTADSNGMSFLLMESLKRMSANASEANTTNNIATPPLVELSHEEHPSSVVEIPTGFNNNNNNNQGPIFNTWAQEPIHYNGCGDLVLLENHGFNNSLGMDIHIRTQKTEQQWTYLSNAVVRIGEETLEIIGGKRGESDYWVNGVQGEVPKKESVTLEARIAGYPIQFRRVNNKQVAYIVDLGNDELIVMKTWNDIVWVEIIDATIDNFGDSRGLMGDFETGKQMTRDNFRELKDSTAFIREWQVRDSEPQLFHQTRPSCETTPSQPIETRQPPQQQSPPKKNKFVTQTEAETACGDVRESDFEMCVFDVMAMNDISIASAY